MEIETVRVTPGDIAAHHQHHAEFAHGVGEAEDGAGGDAGARERHDHAAEGGGARNPQAPGSFHQSAIHGGEAAATMGCTVKGRLYSTEASSKPLKENGSMPPVSLP